ncbi:MAG TPA: GT4 family glycosyltransferase PelF [Balneolaceae bacterium]|nr:GT4 family glycosyltransferase PelF [Balneolaceae bacterium]
MENKTKVLFTTEGTYPFHGGGVSTWAHSLCQDLEQEVDFIILTLTSTPFLEFRYPLPSNVKDVIKVPLWGTEEPVQYYDRHTPFSDHIRRKARTTDEKIREHFLPMFREFLDCLFEPFTTSRKFGELIYGFWKYYQHFDYKKTLSSRILWENFKHRLSREFDIFERQSRELPRVFDMTFGMRWFYHFMMPLAVSIPDVNITHTTLAGFPSISSIVAKYEYGIPMILTEHGVFIRERLINVSKNIEYPFFLKKMLINLSTFITRAVYDHADLIAPVTSVNEEWEQEYGAEDKRIDAIYNGVDTDVFRPEKKPEHTANIPTVVAAAQVFPLKDIETMIRSCHLVRQKIPDVQYILYGSLEVDPDYARKCQDLVKELDLSDHFTFGGYHDTPDMIYNEGDISILSSISEGFPYTVIESMSCERPVVATDVGGIREALEGCGLLCKPRDAKALAEGVIKLLNNDELRFEMGKKARERVLMNYTTRQTVNNYYNVYKKFDDFEQQPLKENLTVSSVKNLVKSLEAKTYV